MSHPREASGSVSPGMPNATHDLSSVATTNSPHELSTLVWGLLFDVYIKLYSNFYGKRVFKLYIGIINSYC